MLLQEVSVKAVSVGPHCDTNSVIILIVPKSQTSWSRQRHSPGCMSRQPDLDCGMICYSEQLELTKRKQTKQIFKLLFTLGTIQKSS